MQKQLITILEETKNQLNEAASPEAVEEIRVRVLGKKGRLTEILRAMGGLAAEERKAVGKKANEVRGEIESLLEERRTQLNDLKKQEQLAAEVIDVTEPGKFRKLGVKHPVTQTIDEMTKVFMNMGFEVVEGPEVETVFMNFDALNAGPNHPSRDLTDTFYITDKTLLRTQTSPVQVRTLLSKEPPMKVISPGRVFRCDTPDATHSPVFHQVEGLVVGEGITMADLKGTLSEFARQMFGSETKTKFRPHHFPFTEPSAEIDISCFMCGGKGCKVCKGEGWIEILGAGMVHPNVLRCSGIDPDVYSGFAFGMGIERIAMKKYSIDDMRLIYENDLRFLRQF